MPLYQCNRDEKVAQKEVGICQFRPMKDLKIHGDKDCQPNNFLLTNTANVLLTGKLFLLTYVFINICLNNINAPLFARPWTAVNRTGFKFRDLTPNIRKKSLVVHKRFAKKPLKLGLAALVVCNNRFILFFHTPSGVPY